MKRFYLLLGGAALVGALALWVAARGDGASRPANVTATPASDGFTGYTLGSDSASLEVVEYSDFECPFCARFAAVQMPTVRTQLIETGRVRWRFRDYPLPGHRFSRYAAHAAQCGGEQGRFWQMHDQLFFNHAWAQTGDDPTRLFRDFARAAGLDVPQYDACMESGRYAGRIEASRLEGERLGVNGTPTFFVAGRLYSGGSTSDQFKHLADSLAGHGR